MNTQVDSAEYARALVAAQNLKQKLEALLVNKTSQRWRCICNEYGAGPSREVTVKMPTMFQHQIATWYLWTCSMVDDTGKRWSKGISCFIPLTELYPMFRDAFNGIDVEVDHPYAQLFESQPAPFVPAGRTVDISSNKPVFIRPIGDLSKSVWLNAELRIDRDLEQSATKIACNVDALEFGQQRGRGAGRSYTLDFQSGGQAFYILIPFDDHGRHIYLPIARVVAANKDAGTATVELDQSVELFELTQI